MTEEPGTAYRRFLDGVAAIEEPYLSDRWLQRYERVLGKSGLTDFAKLPLLTFPVSVEGHQYPAS